MEIQRIPFEEISQFSSRDIAYVNQDENLKPFFKYTVHKDSFQQVIEDKTKDATDRALLVEVLEEQYQNLSLSDQTRANIELLKSDQTFTIITAHQPSLFTGPLYYIYKIISTIKLAEELNTAHPEYKVVPIFITGGEDHDFEEINHLHLFNKTLTWENDEHGAVGAMSTTSLKTVLHELDEVLGQSDAARALFSRIEQSYTKHHRYAMAAIDFTNELFKKLGLVVLDMSHPKFKQRFIPIIEKEVLEQPSKAFVEKAQTELEAAGFSGQAYPREINFFYLQDQARERIVETDGVYEVLNTNLKFSKEEMIAEIHTHPERFSPNVIMRPIFQEFIMPNLAYIGGGGELAYWLERKEQFDYYGLNFPMLIRRNSVLWLDKSSSKKLDKLDLKLDDLLIDTEVLLKRYVRENTEKEISLTDEKEQLNAIFQNVVQKASEIDQTLAKTAKAEAAKQLKSLEILEGKLMRAEKQRHEVALNQIRGIKDKLFPGNGLQERYDNFIPLYLKYGNDFFNILKEYLNPLEKGLIVVRDS